MLQSHSEGSANFAKKHRSQTVFALQSFVMYLNAMMQSKTIENDFALKAKNKALEISKQLNEKQISLDAAINQLNDLIEKINNLLPMFPTRSHYPNFDQHELRGVVRNQILAFQKFLFEEMSGGNLSYFEENNYFDESSKIWSRVFTNSIKPQLAISNLNQVIQKVNAKLPKDHLYPLFDEQNYNE